MIRNQSNLGADYKKNRQTIGNPEFINPFQSGITQISHQPRSRDEQLFSNQKFAYEPNSNKKSNKIKQAKQLLAKRLKEVTNIQLEESQNNQNTNLKNPDHESQKNHKKYWECHMNPISKLTKQPFARSKTCEQLRKQHSLKKERKRNNSATKYNSPQINECQRQVRSTGLYSKQIQSGWIQHSQQDRSGARSNKVQTKQFEADPFGNNMIETFDQEQIKKLSSDVTKRKIKGKYASGKKASVELKQETSTVSEIKYPFRINSAFHQGSHQGKSPNKFQNSINPPSSNLLINEFHQLGSSKFTPRLERYPEFERRQIPISSPPHNINFQRIQIGKNQSNVINMQDRGNSNHNQNQENSFEYSDDQKWTNNPLTSPQCHSGVRSGIRSSYNQNQLVTNLHLTNTILQEKLRIKEIQIQQLNRNYFKLKTQLLQTKNIPNQNIRYPSNHYSKHQASTLTHEKYLVNIQTQNNPLELQQMTHTEFVNQSNQVSSLPSPKFCDGVEEEFARERYIAPQRLHQHPVSQHIHPIFAKTANSNSKFTKKKQLFSSDMSQKISEEFDSEEIFMPTHHQPENSYVSKKYVFKKSHFNQKSQENFQNQNPKRDSYIYTLGEESEQSNSSKKNINSSEIQNSKPVSNNAFSEEMLLEPVTQQISESDKIDLLSPIKSHSTQKIENGSLRQSFRTSLSRSENKMLDDSMRKFDYYLTPQKDENTSIRQEGKEENQGLFERAFSTMKKKRDSLHSSDQKGNQSYSQSQNSESHRYSSSSSKKQQAIDRIIQHAIQ